MFMKVNLFKIIYLILIYSLPILSQVKITPFMRITAPNGGEKWEANSTQTIAWQSSDIAKVKIEFSLNNGFSWHTIAPSIDAFLSKYSWTLPNSQTTEILIRVSDASNPLVYDISDKKLRIFKRTVINKSDYLNKAALASSTQVKIMPLGDSITDGEGDDPNWNTTADGYISVVGFREKLFNLLANAGYNFRFVGTRESGYDNVPPSSPLYGTAFYNTGRFNDGWGGWSAYFSDPNYSIANHLNDWLTSLQPNNTPDVILMHVGTNDLDGGDSPVTIKNETNQLLDTINNFNSNTKTIFAKIIYNAHVDTPYYPNNDMNNNLSGPTGTLQDLYNSLFTAGRNVSLVDMYSVLSQSSYSTLFSQHEPTHPNDYRDVHPNGAGYTEMANIWFAGLQSYLPILKLNVYLQSTGIDLQNSPFPEAPKSVSYTVPANITDWILLEIRGTDGVTVIKYKSCYLRNDGVVIDPDGLTENISLGITPGPYYIIVKDRNYNENKSDELVQLDGLTSYTVPQESCPANLISYWKLNETSGSTYTDAYGTNDATTTNAPTPVSGKVLSAQSFNGIGNKIDIPYNASFNWTSTDNFSFEGWIKFASTTLDPQVILGRREEGGVSWWIGVTPSGAFNFELTSIGGQSSTVTGSTNLADNNWHHVVAIRNGTLDSSEIYVDGLVEHARTYYNYSGDFTSNTIGLTVGYFNVSPYYYFNGLIDEVAIYNSALPPGQIKSNYIKGLSGLGYCEGGNLPIIISTPITNGFLGQLYSYDVDATGSPTPTYSLIVYPTGMTINTTSGLIQWTPTSIGNYPVTVVANNGIGSTDTQSFTIIVKEVPICPSNMISYWKLDETSGSTYLDSYGTNNATAIDVPTPVSGKVLSAQSFNGTTNKINVPYSTSFNWTSTDNFSFEAWVKIAGTPPFIVPKVIMGRRDDVGSYLSWWVGVNTDGTFNFELRSLSGEVGSVQSQNNIADNNWHYVVAIRNGSTDSLEIYVDGFTGHARTFKDYSSNFNSSVAGLSVGWFNSGGFYYFSGVIDEVAIYNSVLSPEQIKNDYIKGLEGKDYCDRFLLLASKVFLEGPYDVATSDVMFIDLNTNSLIPLTAPYLQNPRTVSAIPTDVVDWVLVELRSNLSGPAVVSKSIFLHKSGNLVADDGINQNIFFAVAPGNYYIVVKHRNHLGIMSAAPPVALSTSSTFYDFTTGSGQFYGTGGAKELEPGVWGMWAGDVNADGVIKYSDVNNDRLQILIILGYIQTFSINGYFSEDVNMDGVVKYSDIGNDRLIILNNLGFIQTSSKSTQVPN